VRAYKDIALHDVPERPEDKKKRDEKRRRTGFDPASPAYSRP
jgi:hypothetical protein